MSRFVSGTVIDSAVFGYLLFEGAAIQHGHTVNDLQNWRTARETHVGTALQESPIGRAGAGMALRAGIVAINAKVVVIVSIPLAARPAQCAAEKPKTLRKG
jgi:hypothetical protein